MASACIWEVETGFSKHVRLVAMAFAMTGVSLFACSAQGQSRTFAPSGRGSAPVAHGGGGRIRFASHGSRRFYAGPGYFSNYYPDYGYDQEFGEAPPEEVIEQNVSAAPAASPRPSADAMVIELQGDHWVRVTNNGETQSGGDSGQPMPQHRANSQDAAATSARRAEVSEARAVVPSAVLVFRDGHQEEVAKYMISGATIYAGADYWNGGSWTRKVQIAELDVPATLKLNQGRGANFNLPRSPDEVMIRP